MTDIEAIAAVDRGERVTGEHSLHAVELPGSHCCDHQWRTLFCNNDRDVVECSKCGRQRTCRCNFYDEYA